MRSDGKLQVGTTIQGDVRASQTLNIQATSGNDSPSEMSDQVGLKTYKLQADTAIQVGCLIKSDFEQISS